MVQRNNSEIEFRINCSPIKISSNLLKGLKINSKTLSTYPAPNSKGGVSILSKYLDLKEENLSILNGSSEGFFILPQVFKFKKSTIITPTFWEYEHSLSINKVEISFFELSSDTDFSLNEKEFEESIKKSDSIFICNPNNPTSTYIKKEVLISVARKFKDKLFVIDETYLLFSKDYEKETLNRIAAKVKNILVISSLSKIFSIGGVRVGFCVSSKENIDLIKKYKNPYSTNILAEKILPILLKNNSYINKTRAYVNNEKNRVYKKMTRLSWLKPFKPSANFILVKIRNNNISLKELVKYLDKRRIKIRVGSEFRGLSNRYFRFCIKTKRENDLLIKNLKNFYKTFS